MPCCFTFTNFNKHVQCPKMGRRGWFVPCDKCQQLTSSKVTFLVYTRKDYEQCTLSLCNYCKHKAPNGLEPLSYLSIDSHLKLCFCRLR